MVDCGDVDKLHSGGKNPKRIIAAIRTIMSWGAKPIVLGTDEGGCIPVIRAYDVYGSLCVVHIDAHIDWDGDIREYRKVGEMPIEIVKKAFEEIGCKMGRVGAELGREQRLGISYQDFIKVQDALPTISFVDAADIFWQLRMVKSEAEIAIITKACKMQDSIFKGTFEAVETGMILHIEPGCIEKDGIYVLEEQVLVTESGSKVLSHAPWNLQA